MRSVLLAMMQVATAWCMAQQELPPGTNGTAYGDTCLTTCQVMPTYPGGEEELFAYMSSNAIYPKEARKQWIEGTVYVSFIIEKDGAVSTVKLVRGVHPLLDEEAMRLVGSLERWAPGTHYGKPVRVQFNMPVKFSMPGRPPKKVLKRRAELGW